MSQKTMFEAKCTSCGRTATVPFKPTVGKPVYCRECFSKHNSKPRETASSNSNFEPKQAWARRREKGQTGKKEEHPRGFHKFWYAPK